MRIIAYLRVSTNEQADSGAGLDAQRAAIVAEAQRRGWSLEDVEFVEDRGFSAKTLKRPGLAYALAELRAGRAGALVVAKTDRLSRSLLDFAGLMQAAQREGWALVALDAPADPTTPGGEMMVSVMAVFAQFERRLIGERTRVALQARREAGVTLGRPRSLADDSPAVVRILREHAAGTSFSAIARGLEADAVPTARGGARWYPATVSKIVASRAQARPAVA